MMRREIYRLGLKILYYLNNEYIYRSLRHLFASDLSSLIFHISNQCNYNCIYCYVKKSKASLKFEDWSQILEQAKKIGVKKIKLLGGEPFCADYLEDLLKKIRRLHLKPYIYTNGSLITKKWMDKLVTYKPVLIFKYDFNNETYQYCTQQNKYTLQDVEQTVEMCRERGLRVMTFTVLNKKTVNNVGKIFERSLQLGAFPVFERYLPVKDSTINNMLEISDGEYSVAMQKITQYLSDFRKEWIAAVRVLGRGCGCYRDVLSISTTGEVLPCPYLPEEESLGNIKSRKLAELLNIWREEKTKKYKFSSKCLDCTDKYVCGGGCFTYSVLKDGKYTSYCNREASIEQCAYMLVDLYGSPLVKPSGAQT